MPFLPRSLECSLVWIIFQSLVIINNKVLHQFIKFPFLLFKWWPNDLILKYLQYVSVYHSPSQIPIQLFVFSITPTWYDNCAFIYENKVIAKVCKESLSERLCVNYSGLIDVVAAGFRYEFPFIIVIIQIVYSNQQKLISNGFNMHNVRSDLL